MVPHNPFVASAGAGGPPPSYVAAMKSAAAATNSKFIDMYNLVLSAMKASGSGAGLYTDNLHTTAAMRLMILILSRGRVCNSSS